MRNSSDPRGKTEKSLGGLNAEKLRFSGPGPMTMAGKNHSCKLRMMESSRSRTHAGRTVRKTALVRDMLKDWPSGDLFGLSQNAGMGWSEIF